MSILFTPKEVFDIAVQIERNGAAFYRKAAAETSDLQVREELLELASMEDGHEAAFTELRQALPQNGDEAEWLDSEGDAAVYLQSFAAGQVFDVAQAALPAGAPLAAILHFALERERDSVVFFVGMEEFMPEGPGRTKVEVIIRQEMLHIATLNRRLLQVTGRA